MTAYNVVNAIKLVNGLAEDVGDVLANFQAIAAVMNGNLDDANIKAGAGIVLSKLGQSGAVDGDVPIWDSATAAWKPNAARVKATRATNQVVPNAAWTLLLWDGEEFDVGGMHNTGANTARLVAPDDGVYAWLLNLPVTYGGGLAANCIQAVNVQKNTEALPSATATIGGGSQYTPAGIGPTIPCQPGVVSLAAGDYIAAVVFQNSGVNMTVNISGGVTAVGAHFAMWRIG